MSDWLPLSSDLIYALLVSLLGLAILARVGLWLRATESGRRLRLARRRIREPVSTSTPLDDPIAHARSRGERSIAAQASVVRRVLYPLIIVVTAAVAAIPFIGEIPTAALSLLAAAFTVLVGIAARPLVENAFAGLALTSSRLINIGDTVKIDGNYGIIEDISITHTTVKIWDWRRYVVPNTQMMQSSLINYTLFDGYIWAHVEFWLAYDADLQLARKLAVEAPRSSVHFAPHEEPQFWIMDLEREGYRCWLAAWANSSAEAWMLATDVRTALVMGFREHGIRAHGFRYEPARRELGPPPIGATLPGPDE